MTFLLILITSLPFVGAWLILQTLISGAPDGDAHNDFDCPATRLTGMSFPENP